MVTDVLEDVLSNVFNKLGYTVKAKVITSNRKELCDYQCDDAFKLAKTYHKSPMQIGDEIIEELKKIEKFNYYFSDVEFVSPGFINMKLGNSFINDLLKRMYSEDKFGISMPNKKELFMLDYGGPNIAKPLHVGHMRTAIVGESIKRIIRYMGHDTICDVHLGDYGLQIGQVIYGILKDNKNIDEIDLEYLEDIYPKMSALCKIDEDVKNECARITKELQDGKQEYQKLWKIILEISGNDIKRLYKYLDVNFDLWQGESDAYKYIDDLTQYLESKNMLEDSEGARIIEVKKDDDNKPMPPLIYQNRYGAYLYATTDLATIYERVNKYNPDHILYVVDNRQSMHFEQVFRASIKSGLVTTTGLEFLGYGTVNGTDGKPFKTRSGDAPKLDSLFNQIKEIFINSKEENKDMSDDDIDKIVNSILKFADLQNNREKDYIFDIEKFSNVVGKTGPYILYTYVRIKKILEQNEVSDLSENIYNEVDRNLRLKLIELETSLYNSFTERRPSYIADYVYNVAVLANNFYQTNHVNGLGDITKKEDWLYVLSLTNKVLKEMLNLLMIDIPEFM